jgi:undecaprenyl-diphosphatase
MRIVRRVRNAARAVCLALGLTARTVAGIVAALSVFAASLVVFGGATEDVTQHNGVALSDPAHLRFFIDHRSHALDDAARIITNAGMLAVVFVVAAAAAAAFWYRGLRLGLALAPVISLAVAVIAIGVTKGAVGRSRPPVPLHLVAENGPSFPSGHATSSTAVFLTIGFVAALYLLRSPIARTAAAVAAALLSGLVGISRLILGVHWPSDVVAGWALGFAIAIAVTITLSLLARVAPPPRRDSDRPLARAANRTATILAIRRTAQTPLHAA